MRILHFTPIGRRWFCVLIMTQHNKQQTCDGKTLPTFLKTCSHLHASVKLQLDRTSSFITPCVQTCETSGEDKAPPLTHPCGTQFFLLQLLVKERDRTSHLTSADVSEICVDEAVTPPGPLRTHSSSLSAFQPLLSVMSFKSHRLARDRTHNPKT